MEEERIKFEVKEGLMLPRGYWKKIARERLGKIRKIQFVEHETGQFAVVSYCWNLYVSLWETMDEAIKTKAFIDRYACGSFCGMCHMIVDLSNPPTPQELDVFNPMLLP